MGAGPSRKMVMYDGDATHDLVCQICPPLFTLSFIFFYFRKEAKRFHVYFWCKRGRVDVAFEMGSCAIFPHSSTPNVTRDGDISRQRSDERPRDKLFGFSFWRRRGRLGRRVPHDPGVPALKEQTKFLSPQRANATACETDVTAGPQ